jgi:hypothetical protein
MSGAISSRGDDELDLWSVAAGAAMTSAVAFLIFVRDDPPQHVANWRRGAEGERKTEKTLRPLECHACSSVLNSVGQTTRSFSFPNQLSMKACDSASR